MIVRLNCYFAFGIIGAAGILGLVVVAGIVVWSSSICAAANI